ncbi:hypothetical protein FB451DRAFT_1304608 [Mycena latifolia]|nr:hypothetical protein FB451DRAFT_1304608 [Mycena latifolia]
MHPWYKPSQPMLLALAPPVGNWLTGVDHLKDALLLLLLVFYLHQLIEGPALTPLPRRTPVPPSVPCRSGPAHARRVLAPHARAPPPPPPAPLRRPPLLRAFLSCPSFTSGSTQPQPLSWFSTTLFALLTRCATSQRTSPLARASSTRLSMGTLPLPPPPLHIRRRRRWRRCAVAWRGSRRGWPGRTACWWHTSSTRSHPWRRPCGASSAE